ncbi:MAG TPA: GH3 auxin-responsive promoter family protein, partial [Polyangiaceae bacterium]
MQQHEIVEPSVGGAEGSRSNATRTEKISARRIDDGGSPRLAGQQQRTLRVSPYPAALSKGLLAASHVQVALWDRALRRVEATQEKALRDLIQHAAKTEFGKKHGFGSIKSYADYARRVPVGDYDTFSPYIERMRKGEKNLLVPEFVRYYGNSSGSSVQGKSKFLPITERQISLQRKAGADSLMRYLAWRGEDDFLSGFTLGLFPPTTMKEEGPVLVTSNPALMA